MSSNQANPPSVLQAILQWSQTRPLWLRDALRRIVQQESLSENDLADLAKICRTSHGLADADEPPNTAMPLDRSHLPAVPPASESVTLTSISNVQSVNLLAANQTLDFASTGLTIVYGDNGSGKSGYARILRRACRARSRGDLIQPSIYAPPTNTRAAAVLNFKEGANDRALQWYDDTNPSMTELSAVSVFDSDCAVVHVENKNEVAFRPFGLDVPDKLAATCQRLKGLLQDEKKIVAAAQLAVFQNPTWSPATAAGRALSTLRHNTDYNSVAKTAALSDQDRQRLTQLREDLAKNPAAAAKELRLRIGRFSVLVAHVESSEKAVSDQALTVLAELVADAKQRREAATIAAERLFSEEPVAGVGTETWRQLWESARRYSEAAAYPGHSFPAVGDDARCVLCQQSLSQNATGRLLRFEDFVRGDTEQKARDSQNRATTAWRDLERASLGAVSSRHVLQELSLDDAALAAEVRRVLVIAALRRRTAFQALKKGETPTLAVLPPSPRQRFETALKTAESRAAELEKAAVDATRQKLEAELGELRDRESLAGLLEDVRTEIARLKKLKALDDCIVDTGTTAITNLGNELAEQVLTPHLRDRFADELIKLAENRVRAELAYAGGRYGMPQYQVKLIAKPQANVAEVLSEGENTCVALAGFLTELATAAHRSALVFDDPVCSLDHKWRLRVAKRLVEEAAARQIIVFTHDIVFVHDLIDGAEEHKVPCDLRSIRRDANAAGYVANSLPWLAMRVTQRLDELGKTARTLQPVYDAGNERVYARQAKDVYDDLRATWERALEEVAFCRVVVRHRDYINTKDLKKASVLTEQDCDAFRRNFDKCSALITGHDPSTGRNRQMPPPTEVLDDIKALDDWVRSLRARQKALSV